LARKTRQQVNVLRKAQKATKGGDKGKAKDASKDKAKVAKKWRTWEGLSLPRKLYLYVMVNLFC